MADDVAITPGVGKTVATDDVGGRHFQRVKLDFGGDGVSTPVISGTGLPVTIAGVVAATPLQTVPGLKTTEQLTRAAINIATLGDNTIIAASAANFYRIYAILFLCASTVAITLKDAGGSLTGAMTFGLGGGLLLNQQGEPHYIGTAVNRAFVINLSAAIQVSGTVWYTLAP